MNAPEPLNPKLASFSFIKPICIEGIFEYGCSSMRAMVLESLAPKISLALNLFLPDETVIATSKLFFVFSIEPNVVPADAKFNHGFAN